MHQGHGREHSERGNRSALGSISAEAVRPAINAAALQRDEDGVLVAAWFKEGLQLEPSRRCPSRCHLSPAAGSLRRVWLTNT